MVKIFNGFRDVVTWRLHNIRLSTSAVFNAVEKLGFMGFWQSRNRFLITFWEIRVLRSNRVIKISTKSSSLLGKVGLLLSLESF